MKTSSQESRNRTRRKLAEKPKEPFSQEWKDHTKDSQIKRRQREREQKS